MNSLGAVEATLHDHILDHIFATVLLCYRENGKLHVLTASQTY